MVCCLLLLFESSLILNFICAYVCGGGLLLDLCLCLSFVFVFKGCVAKNDSFM